MIHVYWVSQAKRNSGFSVVCNSKMLHVLVSTNRTVSSERMLPRPLNLVAVWEALILWSFLATQSFLNFVWFAQANSREIYSLWPSIHSFLLFTGISGLPRNNGCVYHLSQVRNTFQYPLSKRVCKRLPKHVSRVVAFIIELYREYESRGRPCHCAAALCSLTRGAEIM